MDLKRIIFSYFYHPLRFINKSYFGNRPRLRVLIYHDISEDEESNFSAQIAWLSKSWKFLSPEQFSSIIDGKSPLKRDSLLLTFDDGFISNRRIAERILNPLSIKALFFVVSGFVSIKNKKLCSNFISDNIYPDLKSNKVPKGWKNMDLVDLSYLIKTGHTIGAHTLSHAKLSKLNKKQIYKEINFGTNFLEDKLGIKIKHFAYPFGNISSINQDTLMIAKKRFRYIYTGFRGDNSKLEPWAIRRDAFQPNDSKYLIGTFLEGGADAIYKKIIKRYQQWGNIT